MSLSGNGPVRLMVVEGDANLKMRATAKLAEDVVIDDNATLIDLLNQNGKGRFVITLDPQDKMPGQQPYRGIVPLDGENMATVIENYMLRSEQMDTRLWLAANDGISRDLLLQKRPWHSGKEHQLEQASEEDDLETWNSAVVLASTLKQEELLSTDINTLMQRLFWEETMRVFHPSHPAFHCSCTREKVGNILKMLGEAEVQYTLADLGHLGINSDFCGKHDDCDQVDCAQLFAVEAPVATLLPASESKH